MLGFLIALVGLFIVASPQGASAQTITGANTFFPDTAPGTQGRNYALVQVTGSNVPNANVKMKAQSTVAAIYVPVSSVGQDITVRITETCGFGNRDNDISLGRTNFRIINSTTDDTLASSNSSPTGGFCQPDGSIWMSFPAQALNTSSTSYPSSRTYASGTEYNIYQFLAEGWMNESRSSARYLNAFKLESWSAGVLVGISDTPRECDIVVFPISCPNIRFYNDPAAGISGTRSWVYSSFYGPSRAADLPQYGFRIDIRNSCGSRGAISLYDVDAGINFDSGQNLRLRLFKEGNQESFDIPGAGEQYELPQAAFENWETGWSVFGIPIISPNPGFGGGNNQYMDLPGSTPALQSLGSFESGVGYQLLFDGISSDNAFQMLPSIDNCPNPDPPISCTISYPTVTPGERFTLRLDVRNEGSKSIRFRRSAETDVATIGLIDPGTSTTAHSRVGQFAPPGTTLNVNSTPDTATRWRTIQAGSGTGIETFRDPRDSVFKRRVTKSTNVTLSTGQSTTFNISLEAPGSVGTYRIGFRLLDREASPAWTLFDDSCLDRIPVTWETPTCSASSFTVWAGQPFRPSVEVSNPNSQAIPVSTVRYSINSSPARTGSATINSSNNTIGANGDRTYTGNANRSIAAAGTYTITWTINTAATANTTCTSTAVTVRPPPEPDDPDPNPDPNALNCGIQNSFITSPLRTIVVEMDVNTGTVNWPNGTVNSGLHIGVGTVGGSANVDSDWTVPNPPPDANSAFTALGSGGGETLLNTTVYDDSTTGVGNRYFINDPEAAGNTRVRLEAPATTGDYTVVLRLYDKTNNIWFPSDCRFTVEVELEPLTCSVITFAPSQTIEVDTPFTSTVTLQNPNLVPVDIDRTRYFTDPDIFSGNISGVTVGAAINEGTPGSEDVTTPELVPTDTGDFRFNWSIRYISKNGSPPTTVNHDCTDGPNVPELEVQTLPYVKLYGNDIFAGGGFGNQCSVTSAAATPSAVAYTRVDSTGSFFQGASAELAIFAIDTIRGIRPSDAQPPDVSSLGELRRLAFANSGNDVNGDAVPFNLDTFTVGGGFGQTVCSEDWWEDRDGNTELTLESDGSEPFDRINLSAIDDDQTSYLITADRLTASNGTLLVYADQPIEDGARLTIYVEGDVVLGRNGGTETGITFASDEWNDKDEIPALFIIAQGNIYVDDRVEQLDGVFVAQPDTTDATTLSETGSIHTCYDSTFAPNLLDVYESGSNARRAEASSFLAGSCNNKLVIDGAFVGRRVELLRTNGSVSAAAEDEDPFDSANNNVAEVFQFNPLLYVTGGDGVPRTNRVLEQAPEFESILSLPPSF